MPFYYVGPARPQTKKACLNDKTENFKKMFTCESGVFVNINKTRLLLTFYSPNNSICWTTNRRGVAYWLADLHHHNLIYDWLFKPNFKDPPKSLQFYLILLSIMTFWLQNVNFGFSLSLKLRLPICSRVKLSRRSSRKNTID